MDAVDAIITNTGVFVETTLSVLETISIIINESIKEKRFDDDLETLTEYAKLQTEAGNIKSPIYSYATNDFTRNEFLSNPTLKGIPMTVFDRDNGYTIAMIRDCDKETFVKGVLEMAQEKLRATRISPEDLAKRAGQQHQKIIKVDNLSDVQIEYITNLSKKENSQFQFAVIKDDETGKNALYAMEKDAYYVEYAMLNTKLREQSLKGYTMGEISLETKTNVLNQVRKKSRENQKLYIISGTDSRHRIEVDSRAADTEDGKKIFGNFTVRKTRDNGNNSFTPIHVSYSELDFATIASSEHEASNKYNEEFEFNLAMMEQPIAFTEEELKKLNAFKDAECTQIDEEKLKDIIKLKAKDTYVKTFQNQDDLLLSTVQEKAIDAVDSEFRKIADERVDKSQDTFRIDVIESFRNGKYSDLGISLDDKETVNFMDKVKETFPSVVYTAAALDESDLGKYTDINDTIDKFAGDEPNFEGPKGRYR